MGLKSRIARLGEARLDEYLPIGLSLAGSTLISFVLLTSILSKSYVSSVKFEVKTGGGGLVRPFSERLRIIDALFRHFRRTS